MRPLYSARAQIALGLARSPPESRGPRDAGFGHGPLSPTASGHVAGGPAEGARAPTPGPRASYVDTWDVLGSSEPAQCAGHLASHCTGIPPRGYPSSLRAQRQLSAPNRHCHAGRRGRISSPEHTTSVTHLSAARLPGKTRVVQGTHPRLRAVQSADADPGTLPLNRRPRLRDPRKWDFPGPHGKVEFSGTGDSATILTASGRRR